MLVLCMTRDRVAHISHGGREPRLCGPDGTAFSPGGAPGVAVRGAVL